MAIDIDRIHYEQTLKVLQPLSVLILQRLVSAYTCASEDLEVLALSKPQRKRTQEELRKAREAVQAALAELQLLHLAEAYSAGFELPDDERDRRYVATKYGLRVARFTGRADR